MDELENQTASGGLDALDRIAQEATADETAAAAAEEAIVNPPSGVDQAQVWAQLPMMFGGIICMGLPELKGVYTEKNCLQWGTAMAQVAEKYGWDAGETMAKWAPEIALTVATIPLLVPTVQAIKARKQKAKNDKGKETAEDAQNVTVTPAEEGGGDVKE